jgi:hypothetical protein
MHTLIRASNSKVPFFFTIVAALVRWGLDRTLIGLGGIKFPPRHGVGSSATP